MRQTGGMIVSAALRPRPLSLVWFAWPMWWPGRTSGRTSCSRGRHLVVRAYPLVADRDAQSR